MSIVSPLLALSITFFKSVNVPPEAVTVDCLIITSEREVWLCVVFSDNVSFIVNYLTFFNDFI